MLASEIISGFEQYVDDATELSSTEELALLQKVYDQVCMDADWEFLKTVASGSYALTAPHITLPSDFSHLCENNSYTDNTASTENNAVPKVIFISSTYTPIQVINWSDRRQYRNQNGFAYVDLPNNGVTFTWTPTAIDTYEFDYIKTPATLLTGSTPLMPSRFHPMLYHLMAIDDEIILRFPRANSYAADNKARADNYKADMALWNANLRAN